MLSYEEHQILFRLGEYSLVTTSFEYGGLKPDWAAPHSRAPTSTRSEPNTKNLLKPQAQLLKPTSTSAVRPSDLDDEMIVDKNDAVVLKAKNSTRSTKNPRPKKEASAAYVEDSEPPEDDKIFEDIEEVDMDMEGEAGVEAERELAISPVKKEISEVSPQFPSISVMADHCSPLGSDSG